MKRLFKKNQIMITALAVMIAVAGYLNYSGTFFTQDGKVQETAGTIANQELLDISMEDETASTSDIESQDGVPGDAVLTSSSVAGVVAQAKLTREQVRAQNKETLTEIIDNKNLTDKQKESAVAQMVEMTKTAELEASVETMLTGKGFSESVVSISENSVDVVVNSEELTDAGRAQIEDIVQRKTGIAPENIVITPTYETRNETEQEKE